MKDYFDELELGLRSAVQRRAHLPWYRRLGVSAAAHRGVVALVAAVVIATPAVAAVGAVAGWFSTGKPDFYRPASAISGLGKVVPKDGKLLSLRVPDPDGGPPWGMRLVTTNRGATCVQVGRVVRGQIGSLGIDGAWHDDHKFHAIEPDDQRADICSETDAAGDGFVNKADYGVPASVDVPLDNSGAAGRCSSPFATGTIVDKTKCPASAMRVIFTGLLGPDARSVTYKAMSGRTGTERTAGGVGAYLLVFRETGHNCGEPHGLTLLDSRCSVGPDLPTASLQAPTAVTNITYAAGKTCSTQPEAAFVTDYTKLVHRITGLTTSQLRRQFPPLWRRFLAQHHLTDDDWLLAAQPECQPVGWLSQKVPALSPRAAAPIMVKLHVEKRVCLATHSPDEGDVVVPCAALVRGGVTVMRGGSLPNGDNEIMTVSFTAPVAVRTNRDSYQVGVQTHWHDGGYGVRTGYDIRRGQRVTLSFVAFPFKGLYDGTISYAQDTDQNGPGENGMHETVIGRFHFKLP